MNYKVTDVELTATANKIRSKGGTSAQIEWKSSKGFADAVDTLPGEATLTTKSVTENGTYTATDDSADGYSSVTVNVPSDTLVSKTITQNGTYDPADDSANGYSSVTVNVSGGSGDVDLFTSAEWRALTTSEKQAYGLVAIQIASSGYNRGVLVNGADYQEIGVYLPYSDQGYIICEAYPDNFDSTASTWGAGDSPIDISGTAPSIDSDGAVEILTYTEGTLASVDLGSVNTPFTAYIVAKVLSTNSSYTRIVSAMNGRSAGYGIMLYGYPTVQVSSWGSDTSTGKPSDDYFVGVIQYGGLLSGKGSAINYASETPAFVSKTPGTAGRYVVIGRTDIDSSTANAEPTDMAVKYLAVTTDVESETVMSNNMQYLAQQFIS